MLKIVHSGKPREPSVLGADETGARSKNGLRARWTTFAITLLFLLALAVTGIMAYSARQQWWQMMSSIPKG